ncbi:hypothetical protein SBRCBS47491_005985 [Sporothrix bragantina]|uniref:Uncharacterized protein n=1 Tax=Sporothrix bragantina TaxID=671064 RepID=A0ABP0C218_9PEZI
MLTNSPGSMHELSIPKRDSVVSEKNRLLGLVFFQDEDDVAWSNINLIHSIDAITGLECRRRQDLDAIAVKLGIRSQRQLDNARQQMDPALDMLEHLIAQNTQAQYLFRTVYMGTRICTLCHNFKSSTRVEFTMQLLNALFPPYLASYPVPCIDVQEVRTVREKIYIVLMDAEVRFGGGAGKARAEAFQNDLLSQFGIGSWPAEIWPALTGYLARVESVKATYAEVFDVQEETGLGISETPALVFRVEEPDAKRDSASEPQPSGIKSILKTSSSSMSGQSVSTYGSSYSSASELMMHPLARKWFLEIDDAPSRQSNSSTRLDRDTITRSVVDACGGSSGRAPSLLRNVSGDSSVSFHSKWQPGLSRLPVPTAETIHYLHNHRCHTNDRWLF